MTDAKAEREAIVAWLRKGAHFGDRASPASRAAYNRLAELISRGQHQEQT